MQRRSGITTLFFLLLPSPWVICLGPSTARSHASERSESQPAASRTGWRVKRDSEPDFAPGNDPGDRMSSREKIGARICSPVKRMEEIVSSMSPG